MDDKCHKEMMLAKAVASDLGRVVVLKNKMDACNAVERELEKLLDRFSAYKDSVDKLDELINHVKATKNGIDEGLLHFACGVLYLEMRCLRIRFERLDFKR